MLGSLNEIKIRAENRKSSWRPPRQAYWPRTAKGVNFHFFSADTAELLRTFPLEDADFFHSAGLGDHDVYLNLP